MFSAEVPKPCNTFWGAIEQFENKVQIILDFVLCSLAYTVRN